VAGIELNPHQAEHIRAQGIACEESVLTAESLGGRKFDVIYHSDVLCHLPDPIADLTTMRRKLKAGGCIVFETGNGADIDPQYYPYIPIFQFPYHLFFFGRRTLVELLERAGFVKTSMHSWSILPHLALLKLVRRSKRARESQGATNGAGRTTRPSFARKMKRGLAAYVTHAVRYGLGRFVSRRKAPETLLVTAWNPS
jgi:SAM-dependent methyltransferase